MASFVNLFIQNTSKTKFLVIKRSATDKFLPLMLALPGGQVEVGESIESAAHRESKEELGVDISAFNPVASLTTT
jgi:8-oxo-dGTP pyrophosphatase MutT (NUDIX family)